MFSSLSSAKKAGNNMISLKIKRTDKISPCIKLELLSNMDEVTVYSQVV